MGARGAFERGAEQAGTGTGTGTGTAPGLRGSARPGPAVPAVPQRSRAEFSPPGAAAELPCPSARARTGSRVCPLFEGAGRQLSLIVHFVLEIKAIKAQKENNLGDLLCSKVVTAQP